MTAKGLPVLLIALSMLLVGCAQGEISQRTSAQSLEPDTEPATATQTTYSTSMENWRKDCSRSYSSACLKLDVVSFVDRLSEQDDLGILPGVSVVRQNRTGTGTSTTTDVVANLARDFPHDVDKRMDAYLMHKIGSYLNSHAISIRLFDPRTFEAARSFNDAALEQLGFGGDKQRYGSSVPSSGNPAETGRRRNKGGGMNNLMAGLMMMKGTLGALGFGALAMLAGKALMTGLMALMLSAIVGLKSLAGGGEKKTTYEIVSKPVYTSSHTHSSEEHHGGYGGGGYGRSLDLGSSDATAEQQQQEAAMRRAYGNVRDRRAVHQAL